VAQNPQLMLYHMAMRANGYAERNIILKLDCLIKTRTPQFKRFYTARTLLDEKKAAAKIRAVWDGITKGVFIPNDTSWKCGYCLYQRACQNWYQAMEEGNEKAA
jgi:putative RecB family exonuclease